MGSKARRCLFGAPDVDLLEQEIVRMQNLAIARARELYDVDLGVLAIQLEAQTEPQKPSQSVESEKEKEGQLITRDENDTAERPLEEHAADAQPTHQNEPHN